MYRWAIEILRCDGTRVGQRVIEPDLSPLRESARLEYLRRHGPSSAADYDRPAEIEPFWQSKLGEPYVGGLRAMINGEVIVSAAQTTIFRAAATEVAAEFVKSGGIEEGAKFVYLVTAYAGEEPPENNGRFRVASLPVSLQVSIARWPGTGPAPGEEAGSEMGIAIPRRLLDEISAITESKRGVETGGALLGHLRWDSTREDLFLEITEQVHARGAIGDATRLRFTAECWAEIRGAVALRQRGESIVGWWHSHCGRDFCVQCPRERQETCPLQAGFLSDHDKTLHRTVFPRSFTTALVATDSALGDIRFSMFGWRSGVLESRGYQVIGGDSPLVRAIHGPMAGSEPTEEGAELCEHPKSTS